MYQTGARKFSERCSYWLRYRIPVSRATNYRANSWVVAEENKRWLEFLSFGPNPSYPIGLSLPSQGALAHIGRRDVVKYRRRFDPIPGELQRFPVRKHDQARVITVFTDLPYITSIRSSSGMPTKLGIWTAISGGRVLSGRADPKALVRKANDLLLALATDMPTSRMLPRSRVYDLFSGSGTTVLHNCISAQSVSPDFVLTAPSVFGALERVPARPDRKRKQCALSSPRTQGVPQKALRLS